MSYQSEVLADSPSAYWRLGTVGVTQTDSSGNGHTLTASSSTGTGAAGLLTSDADLCWSATGTTQIVDSGTSAWANVSQFTVEAWIKPDAVGLGHVIVAREGSVSNQWHLMVLDGYLAIYDYSSGGIGVPLTGTASIAIGTTYHVAMTFDSTTIRFYVNGVLDGSAANTTLASTNPNPLTIGAMAVGSSAFAGNWYGKIDEVAFYPSVLSAARIAAHYAAGSPYAAAVMADSPRGYWRFEESSGSVVNDSSGNGFTGTLQGGNQTVAGFDGIANSGLSFDGTTSDRVALGSGNVFGSGWTGISIEAWFKQSGIQASRSIIRSDHDGGDLTTRNYYLQLISNGQPEFRVFSGTTLVTLTSPSLYNDGNWHHVVGTWNGSTGVAYLYVDGIQKATGTNAGNGVVNAGAVSPVVIANDTGSQPSLVATLDEVAIYDHVLSPTRVTAHYTAGTAAPTSLQVGQVTAEALSTGTPVIRVGQVVAEVLEPPIAPGVLELELVNEDEVLVHWETVPGTDFQLYRGQLLIANTNEHSFVDTSPKLDAWNVYKLTVGMPDYVEFLAEIFVPMNTTPVGPPGIRLWVNDLEIDCDHILDDIRITGAGKGYTTTPIPNAASVKLLDNFDAQIGQTVKLQVNGYTRFWGRITDVTVSWDDHLTQITALGPLENLGWSDLQATSFGYTDYQRVFEVLNNVYGWIGVDIPNKGFHTHDLQPGMPVQTALDALEDVCVSSESRIYERPDGTIVWQPKDIRLATPTHVLDQCYLLRASEWTQESEDVVNELTYQYGADLKYTASLPVDYPWQRRKATIDTILKNLSDAQLHADDMVEARSERTWRMPELTVKLHTAPSDIVTDMMSWTVGDKLHIDWADGPLPAVDGTIEGWEEYITPSEWYVSWWVQGSQFLSTFEVEATPTATTVKLDWTDWGPATEYRVFRNGLIIATVDELVTTYTDTGRAQNTQYTYLVEAWYNDIETAYKTAEATVTVRTLVDLTPPPATITYIGPHNGAVKFTVTHPGTNMAYLRFVLKQGSKPAHNSDGTVYNNKAPGTHTLTGPGTGTRAKTVWYVAVYAVNGSGNYSTAVSASTTFIENPVVRLPTVRNAWGASYGWENQSRVRAGNTSSNTYRGIWIGPAFNLTGYAIASARLLVYRKDGGPAGAMAVPVGTHTYTAQPTTPTLSNVANRGSVARNSSAWIDVTSLAAGLASGSYKGLGVSNDVASATTTYVGQSQTSDGRIEIFHRDKP